MDLDPWKDRRLWPMVAVPVWKIPPPDERGSSGGGITTSLAPWRGNYSL